MSWSIRARAFDRSSLSGKHARHYVEHGALPDDQWVEIAAGLRA